MTKHLHSRGDKFSFNSAFLNQNYNMKKALFLSLFFVCGIVSAFAQSDKFWSASTESRNNIVKHKAVARLSFPKEFKLYNLNAEALRQELFTVVDNNASRHSTVISLPNVDGNLEQFEVYEASNFEPDLQARFPEIRAFSGKGITDKYATLKLSISPQGIKTIVFRTEKENEFIEPYSADNNTYAVFKSYRTPGSLPWTCSTDEHNSYNEIRNSIQQTNRVASSTGELKTMRLAQSCNAEYANYFGATSAANVALVLAAFNATLTRSNGCYERDLGLHLNLIASTTSVIYYNAATDPYSTTLSSWNLSLQQTLTTNIGSANYDIGHMFGASGGSGNAGCIGCVCTNPANSSSLGKGAGITSPADGIPEGDNFDIDYVVHEVGHQLGANHTFSHNLEGFGVNKEVGSGITIMGYAGITSRDVAPHSIDIYHQASIAQIQANLATKTCPVTTNISATNATPVIAPLSNYTIPISTPFALTGTASDANAGDVLTYCWEQNDNSTTSGASSIASVTKTTGPNWLTFSPSASSTRLCPQLSTILAGAVTTGPLPGGDAGTNIEALSSVSRTLNFRLTVRDNSPYSSTAPLKVGQTAFADMVVTVTNTSGPFNVTSPNTAVSWVGGSSQNITWNVANTTNAPVSCANVKISLSTDGGQTFPTVLAASTANDGTETLVIPNTTTTTARIKIEAVGNIFFDISNSNFTITSGGATLTTITTSAVSPVTYCAGAAVSVPFTTNAAANAGNVFTAQLSNAAGSFASPVNIGTLTSTAAGTISGTIPAGTTAGSGYRIRVVSSNPVVIGSDNGANITVNVAPTASTITAGGATTFCAGGNVVLSGNVGGTWNTGATTSSITVTNAGNYFVTNSNSCGSVQSNIISVTVNPQPVASTITAGGATTFCAGGSVVLSGNFGGTWSTGATTSSITVTASGTYFVTNTNSCGSVQSNSITVTVNPQPVASTITAGGATTFCAGGSVVLSGNAGGTWSTGATTSSITVTASGTYFVTNTNSCGSVQSNSITVSVIALPTVSFTGLASSYPVNGAAVTLTGSPAGGTFSGTGISGNTFNPPTAGVGGPYTITYTYTNGSGCTNFSTQQTTVTAACTTPARPGTITTVGGTAKVCPGDVKSYSIVAVAGATSYTWSAPPGGTITAGQGTNLVTITYTSGFTVGDSLRVTANNTCGSSQARALKINRNSNASTPSAITGTIYGVCNQSGIAYSVTNVAGVTYAWSWNVANATIVSGQGTNAITVNFGSTFVTGKLSVTATNACGTSTARTISVYARPAVPGAITGATSVCSMEQGVAYSIAPVPNATSYIWYAPSGSKITDGVTTSTSSSFATTATSVFVNFGSTAGQVRVKGVNSCAQGGVVATTVTFAVCKNTPFASTEVNNPSALVFPNPSNGNFSIRIANEKTTTAITEVTVLNEFGQQVYKGRVNIVNGNISLNLEDKLINGIYMVQYTVSGKTIVKKVMISK